MAPRTGLEPAAFRLGGGPSIQLRYRGKRDARKRVAPPKRNTHYTDSPGPCQARIAAGAGTAAPRPELGKKRRARQEERGRAALHRAVGRRRFRALEDGPSWRANAFGTARRRFRAPEDGAALRGLAARRRFRMPRAGDVRPGKREPGNSVRAGHRGISARFCVVRREMC